MMLLAVAAPAAAAEWTLDSVVAAAKPSAERLAAERFLSAAARELSLSRGFALEAASLSVEAGPRRAPDRDGSDIAVGLELPLAGDRSQRELANELYRQAERLLPAAADLEARLALELAYVDAWEATRGLALARRQAEGAERWLAVVQARVEAGAEAPYETALVASELALARLSLAGARERGQLAWSELLARASLPERPVALADPALATSADRETPGAGPKALAEAARIRSQLSRALLDLELARSESRWSLLAAVAQEGEEDVARLGVGVRLPVAGQIAARSTARDAARSEEERAADVERQRLSGRLQGALESAAELERSPAPAAEEVEGALAALEARVTAGRERPSSVLPLRRQLLDALITGLAARAARARALFQIEALQTEIVP
jgi:hypothetical protein